MRPQDWVLALVAGAPLTSVGGVWLLGLLYAQLIENLTPARMFSALGMLVLDGVLVGSGAVALMRSYASYHWFHPYGWAIAYSIVWLILMLVFFFAGEERKGVLDFLF